MSAAHLKTILLWIMLIGFVLGIPSYGVSQETNIGFVLGIPSYGVSQETNVEDKRECNGPFKGKEPTPEQLKEVLSKHHEWIESGQKKGEQANLCEAFLQGADLTEAYLNRADLTKASLFGATLTKAYLGGATLTEANLMKATLTEAYLGEATLTKANLEGATLTKANLMKATLTEANLMKATLTEAYLGEATLTKANLEGATLTEAVLFEADLRGARVKGIDFQNVRLDLKPNGIPYIPDFGNVKNLSQVSFTETPHTLIELRQGFKEAGMRQQEREISFAIKRGNRMKTEERARKDGKISDWGSYVEARATYYLFELTCDWGMSPGKPLRMIFYLMVLMTLFYARVLLYPYERAKIFAIFPPKIPMREFEDQGLEPRHYDTEIEVHVTKELFFPNARIFLKRGPRKKLLRPVLDLFAIVLGGLYFSFLSAFRLGWRDLNVGTWISRIQPRDYTLRATGWVKFVSGIQSLISVFLLALAILTYFGRPFE